jgi:hypothetical protein
MKLLYRAFSFAWIPLIIMGCATTQGTSGTAKSASSTDTPEWFNQIPQSVMYLYAVGMGDTRLAAEEDARGSIAGTAQTFVEDVFRQSIKELQTSEQHHFSELVESQIETISRLSISGIEIVEYHEYSDGRYACLVRILRSKLEDALDQQQEFHAKIIRGYIERGVQAEENGKLGTALKNYLKAYSILHRLPYPLSLSMGISVKGEVRALLHDRTVSLLSEMNHDSRYMRNILNPAQSMVTVILRGDRPNRTYDGISLTIDGKKGRTAKDADGGGAFSIYADKWRSGTDVRLMIRINPSSFTAYEELTVLEQERFRELVNGFLTKTLEVVITLSQNFKIFVNIEETIDGDRAHVDDLAQKLRNYLSSRQAFRIVASESEADILLEGHLKSSFSSKVAILGNCYKSKGEVGISFSGDAAQTRTFEWSDIEATKAFDEDPSRAGMDSLRQVSELLFNQIKDFFETDLLK